MAKKGIPAASRKKTKSRGLKKVIKVTPKNVGKSSIREIYRQLPVMELLAGNLDTNMRKKLLKNDATVNSISAVFRNAVGGQMSIKDPTLKSRLHKCDPRKLEKLCAIETPLSQKRKILLGEKGQRGSGIFLPLLAPLLPVAANILAGLIFGRKKKS